MLWLFWACATPPDTAPPAPQEEVGDSGEVLDDDVATDVLVVGGGLAGLSAGLSAIENGAEVIILEKQHTAGGAARWASTMLFAGTQTQAAAGVNDSPEALLAEWAALTDGGDPHCPWVQRVATGGPALHDWLVDRGVGFRLGPATEASPVARGHGIEGGGEAVVQAVIDELPGGVLWTGWEVTGLEPRPGGGARVEAVGPDGVLQTFSAPAVVVATGGFLRDQELLEQAIPGVVPENLWHSSGTWTDGRGHRLLQELGAHWENPGTINVLAHGLPHPRPERPGHELVLSSLGEAVWVNADGARFTDESRSARPETGAELLAQPAHEAWAIFDADVPLELEGQLMDVMAGDGERIVDDVDLEDLIAAGHAAQSPDLAGLARALDLDEAGLLQTAAQMEERWRRGEPDPLQGRRFHGLDHGPFVALRVVPALGKAFGGIAVDSDGLVVGPDDLPIAGLYAAGELTGMAGGTLVGERPFAGSLSAVMVSGRVAGESAARR